MRCNPEPGEGMAFTSRVSEREEEGMDAASGSGRCGGFKWNGQRYHADNFCFLREVEDRVVFPHEGSGISLPVRSLGSQHCKHRVGGAFSSVGMRTGQRSTEARGINSKGTFSMG